MLEALVPRELEFDVFARHRRTGRSEFLAGWFRAAAERGDQALCRTVITACHLLSLAYREPQLALGALREIVALVADEDPLRPAIVDRSRTSACMRTPASIASSSA